jgi:hypothetical protein
LGAAVKLGVCFCTSKGKDFKNDKKKGMKRERERERERRSEKGSISEEEKENQLLENRRNTKPNKHRQASQYTLMPLL